MFIDAVDLLPADHLQTIAPAADAFMNMH